MCDIVALDRYYDELLGFLETCPLPIARSVATAQFILSVPQDLRGRKYYLETVSPYITLTPEQLPPGTPIPRDRELIGRAASELRTMGFLEHEAEQDLARLIASPARLPVGSEPTEQILLRIPVVQSIPAPLWRRDAAGEVGMIAELAIVPRRMSSGEPRVIWNNAYAERPHGRLRALVDVAADAYLAARQFVREARPSPVDEIGFELSVPDKEVAIAGDSIGAGLCAAFVSVILACLRPRSAHKPRADLAWTGGIRPSGDITSVDHRSLVAKAEATHSAGLGGLVVPAEGAEELREVLMSRGLSLTVHDVRHMHDYMSSQGLRERWSPPIELRCPAPRGGGRSRTLVIATLLLLALGAVAIRWILTLRDPPLRAADVRMEILDGGRMIRLTWPEQPEPVVVREGAKLEFHAIVDDLAGARSRSARLVYATSYGKTGPGKLVVFDPASHEVEWTYVFTSSGLYPEPLDQYPDACYSAKTGAVGDCDSDTKNEIVLSVALNPRADGFLWLFDGFRDPVGVIHHPGYLETVIIADVDSDGAVEIVAGGHYDPNAGLSLLVLRTEHFDAFRSASSNPTEPTPVTAGHSEGRPCVMHLVMETPEELRAVAGRRELSWIPGVVVEFIRSEYARPVLRSNLSVIQRAERLPDYILTLCVPCEVISLVPTTIMREFQERLPGKYMSPDLCSPTFLAEWQEQITCSDTIQYDR